MDRNISKSHLKNIEMHVGHVMKEYIKKRLVLTWSIPGFFTQQSSALYTKWVKSLDFDLKLKKDKNSFVVNVDTKECEMFVGMICNAFSQGSRTPVSADDRQLSNTLHQFIFQPNAFQVLKDRALSQSTDTMELQFKLGTIRNKEIIFPHNYGRDRSIFEEIKVCDVFPGDFTMRTDDGGEFSGPKSLLAARCKVFRNYFNDPRNVENKMQINTSARSFLTLLYYLYYGQLYLQEESEMLEIVKLSWELDILPLKTNCVSFIRPFVNSRNVRKIRKEGKKTGLKILVEVADMFLASTRYLKYNQSTNVRKK